MKKLVLIGGGGHCKSCIEVVESAGEYEIAGILDKENMQPVLGYPVIGTDDNIPELIRQGFSFLITVGQIESAAIRIKLYQQLKSLNASLATIVASSAAVSKHAKLGSGTIVMHHAFVNAAAVIGENTIINTGALIEHDAKTGNHCHISTHAVVNGDCILGDEVFIGSNAVLRNGISICNKTVIGAGAIIHKSITTSGIYSSQPFQKIR